MSGRSCRRTTTQTRTPGCIGNGGQRRSSRPTQDDGRAWRRPPVVSKTLPESLAVLLCAEPTLPQMMSTDSIDPTVLNNIKAV